MKTETARTYVQSALSAYGAFFRNLALNDSDAAKDNLEIVQKTDKQARAELSEEELRYYQTRRTRLMRLFRSQLMSKMRDDVEKEILSQVEELVMKLENDSSTDTTQRIS